MRTDHDLFREWLRWALEQTAQTPESIEKIMADFQDQHRKQKPAPLPDAEYEAELLRMKQHPPGDLLDLLGG